jgi:GH24 family phage-related lysozyme (muramidase)
MGESLSNVLGAPFSPFVIEQLNVRAQNNSSSERSEEQILYLANKMSWSKLTSSVIVNPKLPFNSLQEFYLNLFDGQIPNSSYTRADSLAKNWILFAGTAQVPSAFQVSSAYGGSDLTSLRYGVGPNGAYGLGGNEQGYQPMPGIESITIDTKGTLGSLREANIGFKVWNMTQLNVIEALYFRLGYTMFLEWGQVNYFDNNNVYQNKAGGIDFFDYVGKKESLQHAVKEKVKSSNGNYDAMIGTVSNFYYSFNNEGGFDCNLKLVGQGAIIDTIKTNQAYKMPSSLASRIAAQTKTIQDQQAEAAALGLKNARAAAGLPGTLPKVPNNIQEIQNIYKLDTGAALTNTGSIAYPSTGYVTKGSQNATFDYYYKAVGTNKDYNTSLLAAELNASVAGLYLAPISGKRSGFQTIPAIGQRDVTLRTDDLNFLASSERSDANDSLRANIDNAQQIARAAGFNAGSVNTGYLSAKDKRLDNIQYQVANVFDSAIAQEVNTSEAFAATEIKTKITTNILYSSFVINPTTGARVEKKFLAQITYTPPPAKFPTRRDVVLALDGWLGSSKTITITSIKPFELFPESPVFGKYIAVTGKLKGVDVPGEFTISFTDTGLINKVLAPTEIQRVAPAAGTTADPQGETEGAENETDPFQDQEASKYNSALHTMLTSVIAQAQATGSLNSGKTVVEINIAENTKLFYESGVFSGLFNIDEKTGVVLKPTMSNTTPTTYSVLDYARKGFNSNIMADKPSYGSVEPVDFQKLCTAYFFTYQFPEKDEMSALDATQCPVYIKFGYLLAFLNNMCLLYETSTKTEIPKSDSPLNQDSDGVKPYVYIDFHPEYNLCLTSPQHLTVDPSKCFIPLEATKEQYLRLFPDDIAKDDAFKNEVLNPGTENNYSAFINSFKTGNAYQGKTMEILLNAQYLLKLLNQFADSDNEGAVQLKPLLDKILDDINKSTGGYNYFRVAYRDDSNTIIIKDDQWVPNLPGEDTTMDRKTYNKAVAQLPIFGKQSLVRAMEFKTNMNTKMSSKIAISAMAGNQVANAQDATAIGAYNVNYVDSIMKVKQNSTTSKSSGKTNAGVEQTQKIDNTSLDAARKFNQYIKQVYKGGRPPKNQVQLATNYYINRLTIVKAEDEVTRGAPFIPANLSITLDGISGIIIGTVFTIPENRLPSSLRGSDLVTKVGFAVMGLTQTLESNQWLTKIRGQMIYLRTSTASTSTAQIGGSNVADQFQALGTGTANLALTGVASQDAINFIKSFEGLYSAKAGSYVQVNNPTPNTVVYAYKDSGGVPTIGWGTTRYVTGRRTGAVNLQDSITVAEAEDQIRVEVATIQTIIEKELKPAKPLTNGQLTALISLGYNTGIYGLKESSMWKGLKSGTDPRTIAQQILSYKPTVDGKISQGLVNRRKSESQIFLS